MPKKAAPAGCADESASSKPSSGAGSGMDSEGACNDEDAAAPEAASPTDLTGSNDVADASTLGESKLLACTSCRTLQMPASCQGIDYSDANSGLKSARKNEDVAASHVL